MSNTITQMTHLFVFLLAIIPSGYGEFVLCQGDDGHVEVELSQQGSCFTRDHHEEESLAMVLSEDLDHCGPCVDVAFQSSSRFTKDIWSADVLWLPIEKSRVILSERLTTVLLPRPPPVLAQTLVCIKTIRLLI